MSFVELPGCFNCLLGRGSTRRTERARGKRDAGSRRDAEGDWTKGCSALLGYPVLASTARSCSFWLSVNKWSSMDRSLPSITFLLLPFPLSFLMLSSSGSIASFPRYSTGHGPRGAFLIARAYMLPGTRSFKRELRRVKIDRSQRRFIIREK